MMICSSRDENCLGVTALLLKRIHKGMNGQRCKAVVVYYVYDSVMVGFD